MVLLPAARFAQIQFPEDLKQWRKILQLYHNHLLAGHPGISNTTHLLSQTYEGRGMKEFTEDYVRGCTVCQENKPCMTHQKALLQPIMLDPPFWTFPNGGHGSDHGFTRVKWF